MRGIPTRGRGLSRRQTSEKALLDAFEALLQRHGPAGLGVNAVLDSAQVGKRLLYEYFGDLEGLAAAWARGRTDPLALQSRAPAMRRRIADQPPVAALATTMAEYAEQLRAHPWAAQVLLAELAQPATLGRAMREIRLELGKGYEKLLVDGGVFDGSEAAQLGLILHAAATYLAMRARFAPDYNGIDLSSPQGWKAVMETFEAVARLTHRTGAAPTAAPAPTTTATADGTRPAGARRPGRRPRRGALKRPSGGR